jgi:hypothetical protein
MTGRVTRVTTGWGRWCETGDETGDETGEQSAPTATFTPGHPRLDPRTNQNDRPTRSTPCPQTWPRWWSPPTS